MNLGEQQVADAACDVVLEMKQLSGRTLDQQCTDMAALIHIDKLRVDSHLRALALYGAIDDVVNAKAPPRLDGRFCFPARRQCRVGRNHTEFALAGESVYHHLRDAAAELRIIASAAD